MKQISELNKTFRGLLTDNQMVALNNAYYNVVSCSDDITSGLVKVAIKHIKDNYLLDDCIDDIKVIENNLKQEGGQDEIKSI